MEKFICIKKRLAFSYITKGFAIRHCFFEHGFSFVLNFEHQFIAIFKTRVLKIFRENIGPHISEVRVNNFKISGNHSFFGMCLRHRNHNNFFRRIFRTEFLKRNLSCGKSCGIVSKKISSVKNRAAFAGGSSVCVIDHTDFFNPVEFYNMSKTSVIGGYNDISVFCFYCGGSSVRSYTRIHNGNKNSSLGPEANSLPKAIACAPCVKMRNFVASGKNLKASVNRFYNAVHCGNGAFLISKVCLENKNWFFHFIISSDFCICFIFSEI